MRGSERLQSVSPGHGNDRYIPHIGYFHLFDFFATDDRAVSASVSNHNMHCTRFRILSGCTGLVMGAECRSVPDLSIRLVSYFAIAGVPTGRRIYSYSTEWSDPNTPDNWCKTFLTQYSLLEIPYMKYPRNPRDVLNTSILELLSCREHQISVASRARE